MKLAKPYPETLIVLPDLHIPHHDKAALRAIEHYVRDIEPAALVGIGDTADYDLFGPDRRKQSDLQSVTARQMRAQADGVCRWLDVWRPLVKDFILIEGNHDIRPHYWINANPSVEPGYWEFETYCQLEQRDIHWVPFWETGEILTIGEASFIHGDSTSKYHAEKMMGAYGENVFYGHCHDRQVHTKRTKNKKFASTAESFGCLQAYDPKWMRGRPNAWQLGFAKFYFQPNGRFWHTFVPIFNGEFVSPEGWRYTATGSKERGTK